MRAEDLRARGSFASQVRALPPSPHTFDVRDGASALLTSGPYRFSRNPAYGALTLAYAGGRLLLNNAWILLSILPLMLWIDLWVIRKEEAHLEAKFGKAYRQYKSTVRRWL